MELNLRGDEVERWGVFVAELDQERIITRSFVVVCFTLAPPYYRPYVLPCIIRQRWG